MQLIAITANQLFELVIDAKISPNRVHKRSENLRWFILTMHGSFSLNKACSVHAYCWALQFGFKSWVHAPPRHVLSWHALSCVCPHVYAFVSMHSCHALSFHALSCHALHALNELLTTFVRRGNCWRHRSAIGLQAGAAVCLPIADRLPLYFCVWKRCG